MSIDEQIRLRWNATITNLKALLKVLDSSCTVAGNPADYTLIRADHPKDPSLISLKPKGFIVLENLPPCATDAPVTYTERVNIFVNGYLVFNNQSMVLQEYCTKVMSFRRGSANEPDRLVPIDGFRCEMDLTEDPSHPLFHLQRHNAVGASDLYPEQRLRRYQVDAPVKGLFANQHMRIPTAQLDLLSIFVPLIADHLIVTGMPQNKLDAYKQFVQKTRTLSPRVLDKFRPVLTMVEKDQVAHASHWYPAH